MMLMTWKNAYSVGIESIDNQHKRMIEMINDLYEGIKANKEKETLAAVFERLILHTAEHFDYEERLFEMTHYPMAADHKQEHMKLSDQVMAYHKKFQESETASISAEVLNFLGDWLVNHIQGKDKLYASHLQANNVT